MGLLTSLLYRARAFRPMLEFRGLKVPVAGDHVSRTVWKHIRKGGYERPEIDALSALVRPGDRILELGTGMGIVSGVVARQHPDVSIEAYEANPALIEPILELHELNGIKNVRVHNAILLPTGDTTPMRFNLHSNFTESSISDAISSEASIDVPVRDFRTILAEFRPDILVCDIEGAEEHVFDGVDLGGLRAVVIELHPHLISRDATERIYDTCAEAGLAPSDAHSSHQVVAFERAEDTQ